MKIRIQAALAGAAGAFLISTASHAAYLGLVVTQEPSPAVPAPDGPLRAVLHVYAEFSTSSERVNAWGIGQNFGPGFVRNVLNNLSPGSGFTQVGGNGGNLAPYYANTPRDWDTYATIGVRYGSEAPNGLDATSPIPGTPPFINGHTWTGEGIGYFITPDDPQGRGDYRVAGSDTANRVLLMQLVVNAGEAVWGRIGLAIADSSGQGTIIVNQMFLASTQPPAPGSLTLLGVAALYRRRRRR